MTEKHPLLSGYLISPFFFFIGHSWLVFRHPDVVSQGSEFRICPLMDKDLSNAADSFFVVNVITRMHCTQSNNCQSIWLIV